MQGKQNITMSNLCFVVLKINNGDGASIVWGRHVPFCWTATNSELL